MMRRTSTLLRALGQLRSFRPDAQPTMRGAHLWSLPWRGKAAAIPAGRCLLGAFSLGRSNFTASLLAVPYSAPAAGAAWMSFSPSFAKMLSMHKTRLASMLHDFEVTSLRPGFAKMLSSVDKKRLASKLQNFEVNLAALVCSVTDTRSGQRLLSGILPLAAMVFLFPSRFKARAWELPCPPPQSIMVTANRSQWLSKLRLPAPVVSAVEELLVWMRGLYLALLFSPVLLTAPMVFYFGLGKGWSEDLWMDLLLWTIERAGPAFIKWAQWSSSRPDLFPQTLCQRFEQLQSNAPAHDGRLSNDLINAAFRHLSQQPVFEYFDPKPVASGSIAQVHRAHLSAAGAALTGHKVGHMVAVKVRHPGVTHIMHRDFILMQRAAQLCGLLPGLSNLRLDESIRQFGGPLKEQLDLVVEARHLERFNHNFRLWQNVSFPRPLYPLVACDVLVESFEEGDLISGFVNLPEPSKQRCLLAETGLNLYLQMLLKDNFCHADLHPGNILVRAVDTSSLRGLPRLLSSLLPFEFAPRLVLLDAGMTCELKPTDQRNLVDFFRALTRQDGANIARSILTLSELHTCTNPDAFVTAMTDLFNKLDPSTISKNTNAVFQDMIETLRQHQVTLKSAVSTIVVTTLVLEGWSTKLDPELHILDSMKDILGNSWSERISRTVDRLMASGSVVVA